MRPDFDLFSAREKSWLQPLSRKAFDWIEANQQFARPRLCGAVEVTPSTVMPVLEQIAQAGMVVS